MGWRRRTRRKCSSPSLELLNLSSRYFLKRSKTDISRNVKFLSACLERSLGDPCDAELSSVNNPRPEVDRDQANQWTEHCESNSDARNYTSGKLLIGRGRNAFQAQLPPSGIELRRCHQLGLRSLHLTNIPNACTRSVAGINPGSAHHYGCSRECDYCADEWTECRKPETCLHAIISSVRRSTFQKILRLLARSFNTASGSHP